MAPSSLKNRPIAYGIPKGKSSGGMLDYIIKTKRLLPSPSQYKIKSDILPTRSNIYGLNDKSPRRTVLGEIEHRAKLHKRPGVGAYELKYDKLEARTHNGPMDKSDRLGYLDEIEFHSKNSPGFYDKKLSLTTVKAKNCII